SGLLFFFPTGLCPRPGRTWQPCTAILFYAPLCRPGPAISVFSVSDFQLFPEPGNSRRPQTPAPKGKPSGLPFPLALASIAPRRFPAGKNLVSAFRFQNFRFSKHGGSALDPPSSLAAPRTPVQQ